MKRLIRDANKGIALITVVIGVMFCLLLTSTMLRVSLLGLQSREVNNQAADTYYDAEAVIDQIRMNLQNKAALAWATASNKTDAATYIKKAYKEITGVDYPASDNGDITPLNKAGTIESMSRTMVNGGEIESIGKIVPVKSEYGLEGFIIEDVKINYTNPRNGMVSFLTTNITLSAPLYANESSYPLASYSMFAGSGAEIYNAQGLNQGPVGNPNQFGFLEQRGNVYFGYKPDSAKKNALEINSRETMILSGESVVINGNVVVTKYSNIEFTGKQVQVRGRILLGYGCHLIIGEDTRLDCQDIVFFDTDAEAISGTGGKSVKTGTYSQSPVSQSSDPYYSKGDPYYAYKYASYSGGKTGYGNFGSGSVNTGDYSFKSNPDSGTFGDIAKKGELPYVCKAYSSASDDKNSQGIIYVKKADYDATKHAYSHAREALVYGSSVKRVSDDPAYDEEGKPTNAGQALLVNFDPTLTPLVRKKVTFSDGKTKSNESYDQYFAKVVDIEYWEKFQSYGINDNIDGMITCYGQYVAPADQEKDKTEKKGYKYQKNDEQKYTASSIGTSYDTTNSGKSKTATFMGQTYDIMLSLNSENPKNYSSNDRLIGLFKNAVQINVDNSCAEYSALIISNGYVRYKKDAGHCYGESLLLIDTDPDKKNLKVFLEEKVGPKYNGNNLDYCIFNKLFNGGMAAFYEGDDGTYGSEKTIDKEYNEGLELIDTGNYDKR